MSKRPAAFRRPWERPDYSFYTPAMQRWLNGYKPQLAEDMARGRSAVADSANASVSRQTQMEQGTGWGSGYLGALSGRTEPVVPLKGRKVRAHG